MEKSRVLVVGGTGYIGRWLVRASLAQGHPTLVLLRAEIGLDIDKLQMLLSFKAQGARLVEASLEDHAGLLAAVAHANVVVSAMSGAHIRSHNSPKGDTGRELADALARVAFQERVGVKGDVRQVDFQKDIVRAAEGLVSIGNKHIEVGTKFSEDCYRYGSENNASDEALRKAASLYGGALINIEKEYEDFNRILSSQTIDPLRAMAIGGPLEDARGLAQRYSRMRHEAEILSTEIARRKARVREAPIAEHTTKLQQSEARMIEHKASMAVLGKEAAAALAAVESQQQRMSSEKQRRESAPPIISSHKRAEKAQYFLAEVMHNFNGTTEKELSLIVGDYVVVRQETGQNGRHQLYRKTHNDSEILEVGRAVQQA
ncbi:SH3 domain-containing protein 3 [Zea mays]|uniref:SH3 domain-containing protein 3 n=1 Tax=Zea mays TaxID=4577 RepID=A0A1D6IP13_MAIZE|nr:SH3 domain-containing protein 3 [Zea mays]